jgi:release factor glutamine methyltransferase
MPPQLVSAKAAKKTAAPMTDLELKLINEYFPSEEDREAAKARLLKREPLAYILGEWGFYDQIYKIDENCLIPRPDTEHVVDKLIELLPPGGRFLDLCTGSGCISISTLVHRPDCSAVAVDISEGAVKTAKENAEKYSVSERIKILCQDINDSSFAEGCFDIIVSNPPYIVRDVIDSLEPELFYEPRIALDGGEDGLDFYRLITELYSPLVKKGGYMVFEIGYDQGDALRSMGAQKIYKDYGGNDRVAVISF